MKVIAIDPGYVTGMAAYVDGEYATWAHNTQQDTDGLLELIQPGIDRVIIERFATAGRLSAPGLFTIDLGAQIKGWCKALKIPWEYRAPSERYSMMPLAQGAVGHVIPSGPWARHEVDALAHLFYWLSNHSVPLNIDFKPKPRVKQQPRGGAPPVRQDPRKRMERLRRFYDEQQR